MDDKALDVFAQCVEANVRQTQWATDQVIANIEKQLHDLATAYVLLFEEVDEAARVVTTRRLEWALNASAITYDEAKRILGEGVV